MWRALIPLLVLAVLVAFFARGLFLKPGEIPSPLIGKPTPAFTLPTLYDPAKTITQEEFKGHVSLLNVWGSWCISCHEEHEALMRLAAMKVAPIYGLDYKDERADALQMLAKGGNPYKANAFDRKGDVAINWGVYGAPETFLIDAKGIIRYKYIGPITDDVIKNNLLPRIRKLQGER